MSETSHRKTPTSPATGGGVWDRAVSRIWDALFTPVDNSFLAYMRILLGSIMVWEVTRYFSNGWIPYYYIEPKFHFTYYGFEWVKPWPGNGMYIHFQALGVLALCMTLGFYYRIAAALFFVGFTYVFLLEESRYLNHFYLICLLSFLMIFVPAERVFSLDARRKPALRSDTAPGWTLWLLRAQIGLAYFFGGVAKLSHDWLHGEPMRSWLASRTNFPIIGPYFREEWMVYGFVFGGLLLDLCVVPLLLWRRTRPWAFLAAVTFHLMNSQLFSIGIFPWFMLFGTLIFFPPDLPRRVVAFVLPGSGAGGRSKRRRTQAAVEPVSGSATRPTRERLVAGAVFAWLLVQVLVPLRHFLYPGDVNWTEEAHRFSWHMKLRDKDGEATFYVTDPKTGEEWEVDSREHLTPRQRSRVAGRPDMALQYAHFLAEQFRKDGHDNVEVRVEALVSVNGREPQLLIDPDVDLAKEKRRLWPPAKWILPLTNPLPAPGAKARAESSDSD